MKKKIGSIGLLCFAFIMIPSILIGEDWYQKGIASWYGGKFQGRLTANGEIFDTYQMTAAHKTLPFNTVVEVTLLNTNNKVRVRVNDRGPFVEGRIIDLSFAAAKKLGLSKYGVGEVGLRIIRWGDGKTYHHQHREPKKKLSFDSSANWIQVASFSQLANAQRMAKELKGKGFSSSILKEKNHYKVGLFFKSVDEGTKLLDKLSKNDYNSVLVRKVRVVQSE